MTQAEEEWLRKLITTPSTVSPSGGDWRVETRRLAGSVVDYSVTELVAPQGDRFVDFAPSLVAILNDLETRLAQAQRELEETQVHLQARREMYDMRMQQLQEVGDRAEAAESRLNDVIEASSIAETGRLNAEARVRELEAKAALADALYQKLCAMRSKIPVDWPTGTTGDFVAGMDALSQSRE